jgi:hypothetical protein
VSAPAAFFSLLLSLGVPAQGASAAWILWVDHPEATEANNQQSYRSVLEAFHYRVALRKVADFRRAPENPATILVIPRGAAARMDTAQQAEAVRYLAAGGRVAADGRQPWMAGIGFRPASRKISVSSVADVLHPDLSLHWQGRDPVEVFEAPAGSRTLMADRESGQPLAIAGSHGAGRYLYLAAPLDPHTPDATSHYPHFPVYLAEAFGARPAAEGPQLEAYFDPAFRSGADPERLADFWKQSGIRVLYIAAWYEVPYGDIVRACHSRGLRAYAWFAPPAATQRMWQDNPQWRERTAAGSDARIGWRYSLNLQNPACFRAVMEWMGGVLRSHDWDGVNVTELNYDADFLDYLRADRFVPMNEDVRTGFRELAGFDPALLFQPESPRRHTRDRKALEKFLRYREDIVLGWHRRVLEQLEILRRDRNWEIILTVLDSLHGDYVRPALGVDSRRIAALMRRFDFTLQVEDPAHFWAAPPDRYFRFANTYRKLVRDAGRLMFDVNVVVDRDIARTALPSALPTGTELARTVAAAASVSGRAAIYSEHTVPPGDWALLKRVRVR